MDLRQWLDPRENLDRRDFLRLAAGSSLMLASLPAVQAAALKTAAHIVIAGGGLGGIALANRLSSMLEGAKITILDRRPKHYYQPGYTLVATGVWPVSKVVDEVAPLLPAGAEWVQEMVAEFDPAANRLTTDGGRKISYDFLIVATGLHLDYAAIEGMDPAAIGREGLASVYNGPEGAAATWQASWPCEDG
jgi:sulfide:quinone oxidoreductase